MQYMIYFLPLLLLTIGLEVFFSIRHNLNLHEKKDSISNIFLGISSVLIGNIAGISFWFTFLFWIYNFRFFTLSQSWYWWVVGYLLYDLGLYWAHRYSHKIRFLWASHVVHHSSQKFNLSTSARQPLTESLFESFFLVHVPLLGFNPASIIAFHVVNLLYQFFIHTETVGKLHPWFEFIFNTPSHHRVHHSSDIKYLDKNFGETLIIWDRIFGTFQEEEEHPQAYGLVNNINTFNPIRIAFHEWFAMIKDVMLKARTPKDSIRYMFGQPGWSHDGSSKTTEELRKDFIKSQPQ